ncbi:MAG: diacylglycerol kinase family protein [Myxococcota bacterium]
MPGIGIVTNPNSRRNRRYPERMRRLGYILGQDDVYEMTNRVEDVASVADEFKRNDIEILALNGGDGTNHVTLTTFIKVYGDKPLPRIAFLRGGTMNNISGSVGVSGEPGRILLNLVERYYTGQEFDITERDMLKLIDANSVRYGFIFGNGIIANFLEAYYQHRNPSPFIAAKLIAQTIVSGVLGGDLARRVSRPVRVELEMDGIVRPLQNYGSIGVATIEQIGLGFRPFIYCEDSDGSFHVALFHNVGPTKLASQFGKIRVGQPADPRIVSNSSTQRLVIRAEEELLYTVDGDMHRSVGRELIIEAGPRIQIIL